MMCGEKKKCELKKIKSLNLIEKIFSSRSSLDLDGSKKKNSSQEEIFEFLSHDQNHSKQGLDGINRVVRGLKYFLLKIEKVKELNLQKRISSVVVCASIIK